MCAVIAVSLTVTGLGIGKAVAADSLRTTADDVERIFFRSTESFMVIKHGRPAGYDWSDDGCSVPDTLRVSLRALRFASATFADECRQHDFAYRNFGGSRDLDPSAHRRHQVDHFFLLQMQRRCRRADVRRARHVRTCLAYAYLFYGAVRAFGRL